MPRATSSRTCTKRKRLHVRFPLLFFFSKPWCYDNHVWLLHPSSRCHRRQSQDRNSPPAPRRLRPPPTILPQGEIPTMHHLMLLYWIGSTLALWPTFFFLPFSPPQAASRLFWDFINQEEPRAKVKVRSQRNTPTVHCSSFIIFLGIQIKSKSDVLLLSKLKPLTCLSLNVGQPWLCCQLPPQSWGCSFYWRGGGCITESKLNLVTTFKKTAHTPYRHTHGIKLLKWQRDRDSDDYSKTLPWFVYNDE